jgi:flagellar hook-basal body complex protein FliE
MEPEITGIGLPQNLEIQPRHYDIAVDNIDNSFGDMLSNAIQSVDDSMKASDAGVQNYISGQTNNIHDVMISMQQAQLSFQMMVEVRNRLVETYQELSRMQI